MLSLITGDLQSESISRSSDLAGKTIGKGAVATDGKHAGHEGIEECARSVLLAGDVPVGEAHLTVQCHDIVLAARGACAEGFVAVLCDL